LTNAENDEGNIEIAFADDWCTVLYPDASTSQVSRPSSPATQRRPRKNSSSRCGSTGTIAERRYAAVRPDRQATAPARPIAGT
jgi:hypothetical protein